VLNNLKEFCEIIKVVPAEEQMAGDIPPIVLAIVSSSKAATEVQEIITDTAVTINVTVDQVSTIDEATSWCTAVANKKAGPVPDATGPENTYKEGSR